MTQTFCYVNGHLVDSESASVSVFDHGFTVADGVFETLKFSSGVAFAVDRHLARLKRSCYGLGIAFPEEQELLKAIEKVCDANRHITNGRMRITVTSGKGPLGSDRINISPTLVISITDQKPWPSTSEVLLVPWIRNEKSPIVGLKTTSYAENVFALEKAHEHGFSEAIFLNSQGLLSEGTGSNIFLVKDNQILTPATNSGLLEGITRELVIEWSSTTVVEKDLTIEDLYEADELFLTSSTRDVHPITKLASLTGNNQVVKIHTLVVGKITQNTMAIFDQKSSEQINP